MHVFISGIFSINSSDRSCVANITCLTKIIPGVGNLPQYKVCSSPLTSFWKQRNNSLKIILLCWFTCKFAISIDVLDNWTIFFLSKNVMYFYREKNPALEWPLCTNCDLFALNWPIFPLVSFQLAGLGLIIAGAVVQTKLSEYFDFFGGSVSAAAILLIVVGVIIFVIGFFGCCGAYKENYCMTMTVSGFLKFLSQLYDFYV